MACLLIVAVAGAAAASSAAAGLAGHWQLDQSASDDFDAKLSAYAQRAHAKARPRGSRKPSELEQAMTLPLEPPPETADEIKERMGESLRPAKDLRISSRDGDIELSGDGGPARSFTLGETVLRMDSSGTAEVTALMNGNKLSVRSNYLRRGRRVQEFSVDKTGAVLQMSLQLSDSMAGKLELKSVYRRVPD